PTGSSLLSLHGALPIMSERVSEGLSVQAIHGVPADRLPDWVPLIVDGRELPAQSGETFPTLNPANGRELAPVARAQAADVDRAVDRKSTRLNSSHVKIS